MSTETERTQLIADLKAARAELVERGHCKVTYVNKARQVCVRGAVAVSMVKGFEELFLADEQDEDGLSKWARALNSDIGLMLRRDRVEKLLQQLVPARNLIPLESWNDAASTTFEDAVNLFDKALAEAGGLG